MFAALAHRLAFIAVLATSLQTASALAKSGLAGPEWTFTNDALMTASRESENEQDWTAVNRLSSSLMSRWRQIIAEKCGSCVIKTSDDAFRVEVSGDVWFKVANDPWVLEVTGSPMTAGQFKKLERSLQTLVWDTAKEAGLEPHYRIGGGHIHLDISTFFGDDAVLFRNFMVDLANNPELFLGALGFDLLNAPPLATLPKRQRAMFEKVIMEFDTEPTSLDELKGRIRREVYTKTLNFGYYAHPIKNPDKYQAVNLNHHETVEIRGLRPQPSAEYHLKLVKLFQARLAYLKTLKKPLKYENTDYTRLVAAHTIDAMQSYSVNVEPKWIEKQFRSYVEKAGLNWTDYKDMTTVELKNEMRNARTCRALF